MHINRNNLMPRQPAVGLVLCLVFVALVAAQVQPRVLPTVAQVHRADDRLLTGIANSGRPINSALWRTDAKNESLSELIARLVNRQDLFQLGVYVPGVMALPVIQQPVDNNLFVSTKGSVLTQFNEASMNGILGILAHNFLAGGLFYEIGLGEDIWIVKGIDTFTHYRVSSIEQYQRVKKAGAPDEYIDLSTNEELSTREVFSRYYDGEHHLTLQTCLERNGDGDWGLTFIVADLIP